MISAYGQLFFLLITDASCKSEPVSDFNEDSRDSFTRSRSCTPIKPSPLTIKSEHTDEEDNDSNSEQKPSSGRLTMTLKVPKLEADSPRKRLKDKFEKEKGLQIKNKKKCKIKVEKGDEEAGSCDNENIVSTKTDEDAEKHEISEKGENDIDSNCDENIKEPDIAKEESNTSAIKCDKSIDELKSTEKDDKDLDENSGEDIKNDEMSEKETNKTEDEVKNDEVDGLGNEVSDAEVVQVNKETVVEKETTQDLDTKTSDSDEIPTNENDLTLENAGIDKNNSSNHDQDKTSKSNVVSLAESKQLSDAGSNVPDSAESELKETTPLASDKDCKTEDSKDPNLPDEIPCTDKELTQLETESNLSVEQEQKLDSDTANSIEKTIPCKVDQISALSENLSKGDKIEEAPIVSTKDDNEKHELSENEKICLNERKLNEQNDELSATKLDSDNKKDDRTEISKSKKSDNDSDIEQQEPSSESICLNSLKESDIGSKKLGEDSEEGIEISNKEQEMDVKQRGFILDKKTLIKGDNSQTESIESHDKLSKGEIMDNLKEEKCSQDDLSNGKNSPETCTDTTVTKEDSVSDEKPQPKSEEASPSESSESLHVTVTKEDSVSDEKPQPKSEEASPSESSESVHETTDKKDDEQASDKCAIKSDNNDRTDQEHSSGRNSEISERNSSDAKSIDEEKDKELNEQTGDAVKDDNHKTDSEISERNSSDTKSLEEEKDKEINEETGLCLSSFTASPGTGDAVKDDKHKTESTELEEDSCKDTSVKGDNTPCSKDEEVKSVEDVSDRKSSDTKSLEEEKDKELSEATGDVVKDDKHKTKSTELEEDSCKDSSVKGDNTHCLKDEEVKSVEDVLKDNERKENLDDENTEEDDAKCEQAPKVRKATKRQTKVAVRKLTKASKSKSVTSKKSGAVDKDKDEEHSDKESSTETSEEDTSSSDSSEYLPKTKMKGLLAHSRLSRGKALKRQVCFLFNRFPDRSA